MKKGLIVCFILFIGVLTACGNDYWVLEKSRINELSDIQNYVNQLQNDKSEYKGYKVFTISEGKKAVVISSGEEGKELELAEVHTSSKDTAITVKEGKEDADEKNPYIVVGIDEIVGAFFVYDQNGELLDGSE
ncbi:hypothetical protein [Alkalihalobacillus sp. AL-G]|uniref:hypothetical protein n=1 Tax=Alkalihalobacillus sp. AL-G TaxID=2926399 RepID=UPI00272A52E1|nr:hypothetical protein [Alkalihalobacillus sp. AL-G]WLD93421.1 hypothetical protein MOJ78_00165 [Alkalihalobacillus sp. AL-G]